MVPMSNTTTAAPDHSDIDISNADRDTSNAADRATGERADLIAALRSHRQFLRTTAAGLTDDQARQRSTVSELSVGGLIKHVASTELGWVQFAVGAGLPGADGAADWANPDPAALAAYHDGFVLLPDETLADVLAEYDRIAAATDELVATLPSLDTSYPLPDAPWFPPGAMWSVRRVVVHVLAETAQHAGHADIIREAIDGQKTMG